MSKSPCAPSLHSRDTKTNPKADQKGEKKRNNNKPDEAPMDLKDVTKEYEDILLGTPKKKSRGIYYNPLLYCTNSTGKTYYFKYFRAYPYDHRMLLNDDYGEPIKCQSPKGKIHHEQCPWYNPDVIYIIDFQEDLSPSELAAQQKIYNIYQNTIHNTPEHCGCGTAAEIAYMGHNTECAEFQYIHERESYEVFFAILEKRKKVTFSGCSNNQSKRPRLHFPRINEEHNEDTEVLEVQKVPTAKVQPNLSQKPTAVVTPNATYTQPNDPPESLPEVVTEQEQ